MYVLLSVLQNITYDSPVKAKAEIATTLACGANMNMDNLQEVARVAQVRCRSTPSSLSIARAKRLL